MFKYSAFLAVALFAFIGSCNGLASKVLKCPCTFSVSREVRSSTDHENFDVLVSPATSTNKTPLRFHQKHYERHSSRNVSVSEAVRIQSGRHIFRKMSIADKGLYRVQVRHHSSRMVEDNPSYDLELHTTSRQVVCPIVLEPDQPLLTPIRIESSSQDAPQILSRRESKTPRIVGAVGGLDISPTLLPYVVAISPQADLCTGTLLSPRWIMTAAHCRVKPGTEVRVSANSIGSGTITRITRVFSHPLYDRVAVEDGRNFYDIAVAELELDLTTCRSCFPTPKFMPVNFNTRLPRDQAFARVAGFGNISEDGSVPDPEPGLLRQVDVPVVNIATCRDIYGTISAENQQVCAGYLLSGECDSCNGDSGGPLIQYAGNVPVLMGITSFGAGCARVRRPGVYVSPAAHRDFLESTPAIFTRNTARIQQVRRRCARGSFLPFVEGQVSTCTECDANAISPGGPVRLCEECPGNQLRDTRRGDRCSCRALEGFGRVNRQVDCRECRAGFSSRVGQVRCVRCAVDTYAPDAGMTECLPCPGAPRGATTCASST